MGNFTRCSKWIIAISTLTLCASPALSEIYKWVDRNGDYHITDDPAKIPPEHQQTHPRESHEGFPVSSSQEELREKLPPVEDVTGMEITEYGVFEAKRLGKIPDRGSTIGTLTVGNINTLKLIEKTDKIHAAIGTKFGIRYRLLGAEPGKKVMITTNILTPGLKNKSIVDPDYTSGMVMPERGQASPSYVESWHYMKTVGEFTYDGFIFEKDWEVSHGTWTIQISYQDRVLGEKSFQIYSEEKIDPAIVTAVGTQIDRLNSSDCKKRLNAVHELQDMGKRAAPAIPNLIRTLRYYSMPYQIGFDCGSGKAAPDALAKIGKPAIQPLIEALGDAEWNVREGAKEALVKMGKVTIQPLISTLKTDTDPRVRVGTAEVLGRIKDPRSTGALIEAMTNNEVIPVRGKTAEILGDMADKRALKPLRTVVLNKKENWHVRIDALGALKKLGGEQTLKTILPLVRDDQDKTFKSALSDVVGFEDDGRPVKQLAADIDSYDPAVRSAALRTLAQRKEPDATKVLMDALKNRNADVRRGAAYALSQKDIVLDVEPLLIAFQDTDQDVRTSVARILGTTGDAKAVEPLIRALRDKNTLVKRNALNALKCLKDRRATKGIIELLNDPDGHIKIEAVNTLGELRDPQAITPLILIVRDASPSNHSEAMKALASIGVSAVKPLLESARIYQSISFENDVSQILSMIGKTAVEPLLLRLGERDYRIKKLVIRSLGQIKDVRAIDPLIQTLDDYNVTRDTENALVSIGEPALQRLVNLRGENSVHARVVAAQMRDRMPDKRTVP